MIDGSGPRGGVRRVNVGAAQAGELADLLVAGARESDLSCRGGSRVWFSGHDDCYVLLETRDPALPAAVLARLLTLLAGSVLNELTARPSSRVPEPEPWLPERLMATAPDWIGAVGEVTEDLVTIGLAALPARWRLTVPFPQRADLTATLDVHRGTWRITPAE